MLGRTPGRRDRKSTQTEINQKKGNGGIVILSNHRKGRGETGLRNAQNQGLSPGSPLEMTNNQKMLPYLLHGEKS